MYVTNSFKSKPLSLKIAYSGMFLGIFLSLVSLFLLTNSPADEAIYFLVIPFLPLFIFVADILGPIILVLYNAFAYLFFIPENFIGFNTYDLLLVLTYYLVSILFYFLIFYVIGKVIEKIIKIRKG